MDTPYKSMPAHSKGLAVEASETSESEVDRLPSVATPRNVMGASKFTPTNTTTAVDAIRNGGSSRDRINAAGRMRPRSADALTNRSASVSASSFIPASPKASLRSTVAGRRRSLNLATLSVQRDDISKILDTLYLGAKAVSQDSELLESFNIRHIVNCTQEQPNMFELSSSSETTTSTTDTNGVSIKYFRVPVTDSVDANIQPFLEEGARFIAQAKAEGSSVLVHCTLGMSRSATMVIAYLMRVEGMTLAAALALTKECRPVASPNSGFMRQLILEEAKLFGTTTVQLDLYAKNRFGTADEYAAAGGGGDCNVIVDSQSRDGGGTGIDVEKDFQKRETF